MFRSKFTFFVHNVYLDYVQVSEELGNPYACVKNNIFNVTETSNIYNFRIISRIHLQGGAYFRMQPVLEQLSVPTCGGAVIHLQTFMQPAHQEMLVLNPYSPTHSKPGPPTT